MASSSPIQSGKDSGFDGRKEAAPILSRERLRALVFKEKFRAVYKQRLEAGESPNGRVLELQEIIQAGLLQGLLREAT